MILDKKNDIQIIFNDFYETYIFNYVPVPVTMLQSVFHINFDCKNGLTHIHIFSIFIYTKTTLIIPFTL